ncbi:MAG: PVC-type heme-binding CxxCH protein, partial [Planctomycetaceae bacterium]
MKCWPVGLSALVMLACVSPATAQDSFDAQWMWAPDAGAETVWLRREVREYDPPTGAVRIVAPGQFTVWVNGQKIGQGRGEKLYRYNLNGLVERGPNVIAVRATGSQGKAGVFIDGEIRSQRGTYLPFDGGPLWHVATTKPEDAWLKSGYDTSDWQQPKLLGKHGESPWKHIELTETYLDRYVLAPGFEIERLAEPELVGSIVCITWGHRGRLIASREKGPILSVIDSDGDGKYDQVTEYTNEVTNCQGLCMVFDDLYAVGNGPQGTGIYRLPDANHDDKADRVEHLYKHKGGMGEHGPHDILFGPDGWLYHNTGNHAWITDEKQPTSAVMTSYEGQLLRPKFEDAGGHAVGIPVPGGTIWRFTPDGKKWWLETAGFRNEYDIAFNSRGDLFSFDSDMEWDVGMPWYRPVRVNHCIPGAEFGWRSGAGKWPAYYFDSLPGTVDIGRGSPTGIVFYEHRQFPEKYRGSLLVCDWSMGRIMAVFLEPNGATYKGTYENLVAGNPLNVSDIEVARDGSVVFSTGGRGTEGGVYRVFHPQGDQSPAKADTVEELLDLPQFQSAWAREIALQVKQQAGGEWQKQLLDAAYKGSESQQLRALMLLSQFGPKPEADALVYLTKDSVAPVRAFAAWLLGDTTPEQADAELPGGGSVKQALTRLLGDEDPMVQRRACEAFVRSGITPPFEQVVGLLSSEDRWLRYAARLALERVPPEQWNPQLFANRITPRMVLHGMLARYRMGGEACDIETALQAQRELLEGKLGVLTRADRLNLLRMIQLALIGKHNAPAATPVDYSQNEDARKIGRLLLERYPSGDPQIDSEAAKILVVLKVPEATPKIVAAMEAAETKEQQIDYALTLRYADVGWDFDLKKRMLAWYEQTKDWEGGHSFGPYLANIVGAGLEHYTPAERKQLLLDWQKRPFATGLLIAHSRPEQIADFEQVILSILDPTKEPESFAEREKLVFEAIEALGRNASPEAQRILRSLYDRFPDRREQLARSLAQYPSPENWPYLVKSLSTGDPTTLQLAVRGLRRTNPKPREVTEEDVRYLVLAALKLGENTGDSALAVLRQLTGSPAKSEDFDAAVQHYQQWYAEQFPNAPPAELPTVDTDLAGYTYQELFNFLERNPNGREGDAARGKLVFEKAKCSKCHRFGQEGETVGPDLTSVRRRFQRKEIIDSLIYPSQVISDQYRMVTVVTTDGLQHNGMPLPSTQNDGKMRLLLSDATKLEIPQDEIDVTAPSKVSVMPVGVLKDLTLEEIADLFAFLETSKFNELTPANP